MLLILMPFVLHKVHLSFIREQAETDLEVLHFTDSQTVTQSVKCCTLCQFCPLPLLTVAISLGVIWYCCTCVCQALTLFLKAEEEHKSQCCWISKNRRRQSNFVDAGEKEDKEMFSKRPLGDNTESTLYLTDIPAATMKMLNCNYEKERSIQL